MARVKRGGKWVTIKQGEDIGRGGSSGGGFDITKQIGYKEEKARLASISQKLAQQKAQDQAAAKLASVLAKRELNKMTATQQSIIRNKGRVTERISRDYQTKNVLKITNYKDRFGNKVTRVYDTKTGEIRFNRYNVPRGGGSSRRVGSVTLGGKPKTPAQIAKTYQIIPTNSGNYVFVRMPNGSHVRVDTRKIGVIGKNIAGHKLTLKNGKIIGVDGYSTSPIVDTGEGEVRPRPQPEVQLAPPRLFKRIAGAFSIKKFRAYREKQRQDYYDLYGLTGKDRNWATLSNAVQTKNLTTSQKNKFNNLIMKDLKQDLLNPDTAIRAEAALIIATLGGGVLVGAAVGTLYKTPIALAKDLGIDESFEALSWKDVAKAGGVEFGKNAIMGYLFMKLFGLGGRVVAKIPLTSISKTALSAKLGLRTSNAVKIALVKGLDVAYASYLTTLGTKGVRAAKSIKEGKLKTATVQASGVLGAVVGINGEKLTQSFLRKLAKLNPSYVKVVGKKYILRKAPKEIFIVRGRKVYLRERVQKPSLKRPFKSVSDFLKGRKPGQFKRFTKNPGLILKESLVKTSKMPFEKQIDVYSNTEVTAVNTAADQLTTWIKRKKIIRKPIPGEEKFPRWLKKILVKLDSGKKLNLKEIVKSSVWLKKNVAPNITLLERSLYADPASGLRISRLGIKGDKTASLRDILRGDFALKGSKPQVLIFENAKVGKMPKNIKQIVSKIKRSGIKSLSEKELAKIIQWQLKPSAKFKAGGSPIYEGGQELEITAYGAYVKRLKKVGFRYINKKKVTFVTAELWKPTKTIAKQIKLANEGKLSNKLLRKLEKLLSKKLKTSIRIETPRIRGMSSSAARRLNQPILRIKGSLVYVLPRKGRQTVKRRTTKRPVKRPKRKPAKRPTRRPKRRPTKRPKRRPTKRPKRRPSRRPVKRPARRPKRRPPKRPLRRPPRPPVRKPPIIPGKLSKKFGKRKLSKSVPVYYVKIKRGGRIINLNQKPLRLSEAKDLLVWSVDHNLVRSGWFHPLGKSKLVVSLPSKIKGYYDKHKHKIRPFKIRHKKKRQILNGFIEKRKFIQDTAREKAQLKTASKRARLARRKPKKRKRVKRSTVRNKKRPLTKAQRRALILKLRKQNALLKRKSKNRRTKTKK